MCQQPWWHPQWSFCCCASVHKLWSSENKHGHSIGARLYFVDLPYLKSLHAKNQIFWGLEFFLIICPLQPWCFLRCKAARRTISGKFLSGSFWVQGGEQSIGTSSCARIVLAAFNCHPRPTCKFLFTDAFFCFLLSHKCLFYTCLSLHKPVPGTTRWHKYLWIYVLLNSFAVGMLIAKFSCISFGYSYLGCSICPVMGYRAMSFATWRSDLG